MTSIYIKIIRNKENGREEILHTVHKQYIPEDYDQRIEWLQ